MYDSAYEHPECPPDNVIEDDDLFDGWMIHQRRESEKNKNKNRTEKILEGKKLDKAGEVFIMANSQEEAQNIYNLNDNTSRHIIRERNTVIQSNSDMIDNTKLPDVQRTIVQQSNEIFKNRK
jgi:alpha-amylase/alpha-mannosidase (GH57 family)